jgi:hypothetical protein
MTKKTIWAGLALLALVAMVGCGKVRKCKEGEDGCVDQPPKSDGSCAAGLVNEKGKCVEPTGGNGGGDACNCAIDEICAEDGKTCLTYCADESSPPEVVPVPPGCENVATMANPNPPDLSYEELCTRTCVQICLRAKAFCPGHECDPADCTGAAARARCALQCPMTDTTCMQDRCQKVRQASCDDFMCPEGSTRNCSGVRCSDSCADNNDDNFCDDGDPTSASYAFCAWGSDCSDCGPRRGTEPAALQLGDACAPGQDVACQGYDDNFLKTEAWCLRPTGASVHRCVPDCTTSDGEGDCPEDYECQAVLNGSNQPYTDVYGTPGYACVPIVCE